MLLKLGLPFRTTPRLLWGLWEFEPRRACLQSSRHITNWTISPTLLLFSYLQEAMDVKISYGRIAHRTSYHCLLVYRQRLDSRAQPRDQHFNTTPLRNSTFHHGLSFLIIVYIQGTDFESVFKVPLSSNSASCPPHSSKKFAPTVNSPC